MELIVFGMMAGLFFASYALWRRARTPTRDDAPPKLPPRQVPQLPSGERTLHTIQVDDVVTHLATDYIVEGVVTLDEDGEVTRLYRMADGSTVRWLGARPGSDDPLLLEEAPELALDAAGPEELAHTGQTYRLVKRGAVKATHAGNIGAGRTADRARLYEYAGPGAARVIAVAWGAAAPSTDARADAFRGERLSAASIDILPGR